MYEGKVFMNLFIVSRVLAWFLHRTSGNRHGLETFLIIRRLGQVVGWAAGGRGKGSC